MARTQKNKATSGHLGMLKAKLAKLRRDLLEPKGGGGAKGEGWNMFVCFIYWQFFFVLFFFFQKMVLQMTYTQKNKGTSGHPGMLKAKLAKLRRDLLELTGGGGVKGEGYNMFEKWRRG